MPKPPVSAVLSAGFSLIELMVGTLLIVIVFISWLRICNFQAIRKESLRLAGIEKAAGYLDFMAEQTEGPGYYRIDFTNQAYQAGSTDSTVKPLFDATDLIGYTLWVESRVASGGWPNANWAVISLYDEHGVATNDAGRPFSTMSVFMQ
jgi:hypothetical protein